MSDWIQTHWFELGSLMTQCAILVTIAWYGRKALRIVRAFQTRDETLEVLSPSHVAAEPTIRRTFEPTPVLEGAEDDASGIAGVWGNLTGWLQAPMVSREDVPRGRVARWLHAPM